MYKREIHRISLYPDRFLSFQNVSEIKEQFRPQTGYKATGHGDTCTWIRAMIYAMMCGKNNYELTTAEFLAGCNRFGLDNPTEII